LRISSVTAGLAGADEDRTLARLRGLRSNLFDPAIAAHHGRIVKLIFNSDGRSAGRKSLILFHRVKYSAKM